MNDVINSVNQRLNQENESKKIDNQTPGTSTLHHAPNSNAD